MPPEDLRHAQMIGAFVLAGSAIVGFLFGVAASAVFL